MKFVATLITLLITLCSSLTVWADAAGSATATGEKPFVLIAGLQPLVMFVVICWNFIALRDDGVELLFVVWRCVMHKYYGLPSNTYKLINT